MKIVSLRRRHAVAGEQEAGVAEDQRRRKQAAMEKLLRPVEIGLNGVEQFRPLGHAGRYTRPVALGQQPRNGIQLPVLLGTSRRAERGKANAAVSQQPPGLLEVLRDPQRAKILQAAEKRLPGRPRSTVAAEHLVIHPGPGRVLRKNLRPPLSLEVLGRAGHRAIQGHFGFWILDFGLYRKPPSAGI